MKNILTSLGGFMAKRPVVIQLQRPRKVCDFPASLIRVKIIELTLHDSIQRAQ